MGADRNVNGPRSDPMFRVWPNGYVLQESEARDFQPRFLRNKRLAQQLSSVEIGADYKQLPIATANIVGQPASPSAVATVPRGQPRILSVHQKDGPYRTIEDAWADVRDEDIIEILDDGPYRPKRNFSTHPARSVLFSPTLTACVIRAADDANPVVILDESVQQGALPAPTPRERSVLLLNLTKGRTLQLEGLHFRFNTAAETRRAVVFGTDVAFLRCSNCTFFDASPGRGEQTNGGGTDFFAHGMAGRVPCSFWLENNFYWGVRQESCSLDVKSASFAFVHVKNCVCVGGFLRRWDGPSNLELESNTFLGPAFSVFQNATLSFVTCDENIVLVPPGISMTNVVPMPVPPMNVAPSFEGIGSRKTLIANIVSARASLPRLPLPMADRLACGSNTYPTCRRVDKSIRNATSNCVPLIVRLSARTRLASSMQRRDHTTHRLKPLLRQLGHHFLNDFIQRRGDLGSQVASRGNGCLAVSSTFFSGLLCG